MISGRTRPGLQALLRQFIGILLHVTCGERGCRAQGRVAWPKMKLAVAGYDSVQQRWCRQQVLSSSYIEQQAFAVSYIQVNAML
jgi:hypothetical protein